MRIDKRWSIVFSLMIIASLVLAACQPQVVEVEKEVVVEKVVEKAVEIEVEAAPEIAYVEVETEKSLDDAIGFVDIAPGEAVHIAYMLATSGAVEFLGADSLGGIEIAIEEYGQIHGHDVLLTGEDSLCSAEGGQTAATKVASDPTILGVLGTNCSSAGTAASVVLSEAGMLMISPTNTSPALTDPNETWNPGYYRTAHNDKFQGRVAAEFAYNELGLTTAAALHDGDPYTEGLASVFAEVFAELGGTVTSFEAINKGDTDMRPVLTTIAADSPEALYFPIFEPEGNFVGAQSEEVPGLENTVLMGADGLLVKSFGPNTGPAAEGMYLSGPYVSEDVSAYANFLEKYEANTGGPPPAGFAAHAYDGANILLSAIEKVAIVDDDGTLHVGRQALRDAVGSTYRYGGLTGILSCDEYGDCATGEALAIFQLSADNVASEDNWPPEVVYTPTGGSAMAGLPGDGVTLRPVKPTWDTEWFQLEILLQVLGELGYTWEPAEAITNDAAFLSIATGDVDFWASSWFPLHDTYIENAKVGPHVENIGYVAKAGGMEGFLINKSAFDDLGVDNLGDLADPEVAALFDFDGDGMADLYGCPPGWGCELKIEGMLDEFALRDTVTHVKADWAAGMADALSRFKKGENIIYYTWTPNWTVGALVPGTDVVWVGTPTEDPAKIVSGVEGCVADPCPMGFVPADIRITANKEFVAYNPVAAAVMENFTVSLADMGAQNMKMFDGEDSQEDIERHALEWIADNRDLVDRWLSRARIAGS